MLLAGNQEKETTLGGAKVNSLFSLVGKVAIVSGAGRGTGKAIALALAYAGADVVVAARTIPDIKAVAADIHRLGKRAVAVPTDVRVNEQVDNMVRITLEEFQRVDILVNNAGASFGASTLKLTENGFDALVRENLKGCFLCSKAVAESMIKQGKGSIINISSTEGLRAAPSNAVYGAAKDGVVSLTQSLAAEWACYNIRVNVVVPGFIETAVPYVLTSARLRELFARVPLGRAARPEDIAAAVLYFASDAADYVSGAMLVVDGGMSSLLG